MVDPRAGISPRWSRFVVAAILALAATVIGTSVWGRGPVLLPLPWVEVVAGSFTILVAIAIAYFCLGRHRVIAEPASVWVGAALLGYAVLEVFSLLLRPGLVPPAFMLPVHPTARAWPFHLKWTVLAALVIVATVARRPRRPQGALAVYGAAAAACAIAGGLVVSFGGWMPPLVDAGGGFTPLNLSWTAVLAIAFAIATVLAVRRGVRRDDTLLASVGVMAAVLAGRMATDVLGGHLYDVVWYLNRILLIAAFSVVLFGILADHLALLVRERAATRLARARAAELEATIDSLTDAVLVLDARGYVKDVNAPALALLAVDTKEQARRPLAEIRERLRPAAVEGEISSDPFPVSGVLEGHPVRGLLCRMHPRGQSERLIEVSASPVRDARGQLTDAVLVLRDVTELESARARAGVARVATEVARTHTLSHLIHVVLKEACAAVGADAVALLEVDHERLVLRGHDGAPPEFSEALPELSVASPTVVAHAVRTGSVQWIEDVEAAPPEFVVARALGQRFSFRGAMAVPLIVRNRPVGALLCLQRRPRRFSAHEVEALTTIGGIVGVGLANVRLYEELDAERSRLMAVIEHLPEGVLVFEPAAGRLVLANPAGTTLIGGIDGGVPMSAHPARYGLTRVDGTPYPADALPSARALRGEVVLGEELVLAGAEGGPRPVLVNAAPVQDAAGTITGAVVVLQDISRMKDFERQREEFVSVIAHDLRTPIGAIQGYAQVLHRLAEGRTAPSEETKAVRAIEASARRLGAMVNDLLDASRIEAHRLALAREVVDVPRLTQGLIERLRPVLGDHPVRVIAADLAAAAEADAARVEQVLTNLLTNAAKFSPATEPITLSVDVAEGEVVVSVSDRGPGIAAHERNAVFERFYRTRAAREGPKEGLGLGLYISRGLIEAHGGRMWVESGDKGGSVFRFTLPQRRLMSWLAA